MEVIMSGKVIATINLKGGVAKTTTTVGLAEVLCGIYDKRVLVIDLDPQTSATVMLIGVEKWLELDTNGNTLSTLFSDAVYRENNFTLESVLQKDVGGVEAVKHLDMLPSSPKLIQLQDGIFTMPAGVYNGRPSLDILYNGIGKLVNQYDFVLIDCPPNLGYTTLNGLRMANAYIIPTIPDILSTYGIPQIVTSIKKLSDETGQPIVPLGIVATKVSNRARIHSRTMKLMRDLSGKPINGTGLTYPVLFSTYFPESAQMAEAAEYTVYSSLRQKWGYQGQYDTMVYFAEEFMRAAQGV
jgi:chromosome partitioning protein